MRSLLPFLLLPLAPAFAQESAPAADAATSEQNATGPTAPAAATTAYSISPAQSDLYVVIRNDTSASLQRLGHDHVIYASQFTGNVIWPNAEGAGCNVQFSVPVASLVVDPPGLREKAALDDNTIDQGDKEKLKKNMWGKSQLNAKNYAHITFEGTTCSGRSGKVQVSGTLTVAGNQAPITVTMDVAANSETFSAKGWFESSHTALGFKPFAATLLGPRNQDGLSFVVYAKGQAN